MTLAVVANPFAEGRLVSARSGQLDEIYPHLTLQSPASKGAIAIGSSCGSDTEPSLRKAAVEALERYAMIVYAELEVVTAPLRRSGKTSFSPASKQQLGGLLNPVAATTMSRS